MPVDRADSGTYRLLFIASWSSKISLSLASSAMILLTYPVDVRILKRSKVNKSADLPTPYQFSLLVSVLGGEVGALGRWLMYVAGWKRRKARLGSPLLASALMLTSILIIRYAKVTAFELWQESADNEQVV